MVYREDIQPRRAYGYIVKVHQIQDPKTGQFMQAVDVRLDEKPSEVLQGSYENSFILGHHPSEIAAIYGEDLVGYRCMVEYYGNQPDQGIARIVNPEGKGDLLKTHKIRSFSTLFAPAGGS